MIDNDMRELFVSIVSGSLDCSQVNAILQSLQLPGLFPETAAQVDSTAAGALVASLDSEELMVEFFGAMLKAEGKTISGRLCKLVHKDEFLDYLSRHDWIYDADSRRFFLDYFLVPEPGLVRSLQLIDLRNPEFQKSIDMVDLVNKFAQESKNMSQKADIWQITVRSVHLCKEIEIGIVSIVTQLLRTRMAGIYANRVYDPLLELAILVRDSMYRAMFERIILRSVKMDPIAEHPHISEFYEREVERRGHLNLARYAQEDGLYFDIHVRVAKDTVVCWTINPFPLSPREKQAWLEALGYEKHDIQSGDTFPQLSRALGALRPWTQDSRPIKPVFYAHQTRIGFILNRNELTTNPQQGKG